MTYYRSLEKRYRALVKCWYTNGFISYSVLKAIANDEKEAEENIDNQIESWENIDEYQIEIISSKSRDIFLARYKVDTTINFKHPPILTQNKSFAVYAPNPEIAEELVCEILDKWSNVVNYTIHKVTHKEKEK